MESSVHRFSELFAQLGLPHDDESIHLFITRHAPLADDVRLERAPFWTPAQSRFLRDALSDDSDWAPVVDQLNVALKQSPS